MNARPLIIQTRSSNLAVARLVEHGARLFAENKPEEALALFGKAQELEPGYANAHCGEAVARLMLGRYQTGFQKFEYRYYGPDAPPQPPAFSKQNWRGEPIQGRRIVLHHEEGIGDTIQFVRYAPMVAALGADVTLLVPPVFHALLRASFGRVASVPDLRIERSYHAHSAMMSLPLAFGTTIDTVPSKVPYLIAPETHRKAWARRLRLSAKRKIGLVWAGNPKQLNDGRRSMPCEPLLGLSDMADFEFYALQYDLRDGDAAAISRHQVINIADGYPDLADTAAAIERLDLVISVDTGVAHLAGALGKPVWILLPFHPDWRWLLDRADSPWYPTARLFRQPKPGDWLSVLSAVREALNNLNSR